ncbi:Right origin-binding protein (plasmid) [Vibrio sp. THAF191c]|nr:Right origin-binding protein [Vibrio sp. THAF64]QGM37752.1 Right origin-binding protein [Vibrio sp. THAF191d]QGN73095.1 Right origin-binding protein [Vibrio sp. THAF191c]
MRNFNQVTPLGSGYDGGVVYKKEGSTMTTMTRQARQIKSVCDYIDTHLDSEFSLAQLSAVAICSKYHFHRLFKSWVGISAMQYVRMARLKRASFRLVFELDRSVTEIAFEAQFDSLEAFSRAFSRVFGQTPSQFRHQPEWSVWHSKYDYRPPISEDPCMQVNLVTFPTTPVAIVSHQGPPQRVYETAAAFIEWRKASGLSPLCTSDTFGLPHSDPNDTPAHAFRFDIAGTHQGEVPANPYGVKAGQIPGGRCAVVVHHGSHDRIEDTVYALYQQWLPASGEVLRDFPCFFRYLNFVHDVAEADLRTEVYLPLR